MDGAPNAPQTEVVDQAASFQRMIDAEKTIFLRTAASTATPDPALEIIETLRSSTRRHSLR